MIAVERRTQFGLSPVNQTMRLLKRKLNQPRMRPRQTTQIARRNLQRLGRRADIGPMLDQNTRDNSKIKPRKTRRRPITSHRSAPVPPQRPRSRPLQPLQPLNKLRPLKRRLKPPTTIKHPARPRMKPSRRGRGKTRP